MLIQVKNLGNLELMEDKIKFVNELYLGKLKYPDTISEIGKLHKEFLHKLEKSNISEKNFSEELKWLTNLDRIDKVSKVLHFTEVKLNKKVIYGYQKDSDLAQEFRKKANDLYRHCHFSEALRGYNLCIVFAPIGIICNELSLAYANRSAVFFQMKHYLSSLRDILRAMENSYPSQLLPKLLERKSKCFQKLGIDESEICNLEQENFSSLDLLEGSVGTVTEDLYREFCANELFKLKNLHPIIKSAENYISIKTNFDRGRHLVTMKPVNPGTVLIVDEPYAKILLNEFKWDLDHCHHCHKKTISGIPCSKCVFAFFCSKNCLLRAEETYHKYECPCGPSLHLLKAPRTLLLALRILTTFHLPSIYAKFGKLESVDNLEGKNHKDFISTEILGSTDGIYESHSYDAIYHLISHPDKCKPSELLSYCLTSLLLVKILDECSSYFEEFGNTLEMKLFVASLVLLHMQNLPCNAHSLNELNLEINGTKEDVSDKIRSTPNSEYGAGAFALLSLINHSCVPNVFRLNLHNGKTAVVTLKSLAPGEEILDNYGHHYALEELPSRQMTLLENYYFNCTCAACQSPELWPTLPYLKSIPEKFICPDCSSSMNGNENNSKIRLITNRSGQLVCPICAKEYAQEKLTEELNMVIDEFFLAHEQVLQNEPMKALPTLSSCLEYFHTHLLPPFIRINETEETLKQAMNLLVSQS